MEKRIQDLLIMPYHKNCYLIYDNEGDFYVIYNRKWLRVVGGSLYDALMYFFKSEDRWPYAYRRIRWHQTTTPELWTPVNNDFLEMNVDIDTFYIDGVKKDLN